MIAKIVKGRGFRGVLEYNLAQGKGYVIDTNMAGRNPRELAAEFGALRRRRPNLGKAVFHASLSAAPGEKLTDDQWREIGHRYLRDMGFTDNQYIIIRHTDTEHEHIHIVANRVTLAGEVVSESFDRLKQERIMREIELEYGLQRVAPSSEAKHRSLTRNEINMAIRTGKEPPRQKLQRLLDEVLKDGPTVLELVERLHIAGVSVWVNFSATGHINGFSFELDGVPFKGSDLGRAYTWTGLQKAGVTYVETRDRAGLERLRAAATDRAGLE